MLSTSDLDGRRRVAKRVKAVERQLIAAHVAALGAEPAAHQRINLRSAAEMTVVAEQTRAQLLAGDGKVDTNDLVRIQNALARSLEALDIPAAPVQTEDFATMMQRLARPLQAAEAPDARVSAGSNERTSDAALPAPGAW